MSDNNNGSAILGIAAAFTVGAMVGAGLALLYAPQSGKETRDMVSRKTHDLKDAAGNVIEQGKHLVGDIKQKAREVIAQGKEATHQMSDAATRSV